MIIYYQIIHTVISKSNIIIDALIPQINSLLQIKAFLIIFPVQIIMRFALIIKSGAADKILSGILITIICALLIFK
jgi:hypothetical protein